MKTNSFSPQIACRPAARGAMETGRRAWSRLAHFNFLGALLVLLTAGTFQAFASDPIGIYALVDKVVLEPNEKNPERIQIHGAFAFAEGY